MVLSSIAGALFSLFCQARRNVHPEIVQRDLAKEALSSFH